MSITYRPPFDEDDELDLRALYRKPRAGGSPELDAAVRRTWHPGRSWHPGWAAAACAALVAGLFVWTDMRESAEHADAAPQLAVSHEPAINIERGPAPRPAVAEAPAPQPTSAPVQRAAVQTPADRACRRYLAQQAANTEAGAGHRRTTPPRPPAASRSPSASRTSRCPRGAHPRADAGRPAGRSP